MHRCGMGSNQALPLTLSTSSDRDKRSLQPPSTSPTMLWMRALLIALALLACNSNHSSTADATIPGQGPPDSQSDATADGPPALDCSTYCAEISANCTGTNAQYTDDQACLHACETFAVGTSAVTDMSGNTLGCRIYHAGAASRMSPETECPRAGPAGDLMIARDPANSPMYCSGGDFCATFCTIEIAACGSDDAPLPGDPRSSTSNNLVRQFRNMADCTNVCAAYDKTHAYSPASSGDSLACRLSQAIAALISVTPGATTHCSSTSDNTNPLDPNVCAGPPTP